MSNISLDTQGERWMWGGIIGGSSIAFVAISLAIRRLHKRFSRKKEIKRVIQNLYSEDGSETVIYPEDYSGREAAKFAQSIPPYD